MHSPLSIKNSGIKETVIFSNNLNHFNWIQSNKRKQKKRYDKYTQKKVKPNENRIGVGEGQYRF